MDIKVAITAPLNIQIEVNIITVAWGLWVEGILFFE